MIPRAPGAERGFSLIEVLIAMIITAVGLLGIAKMQALVLSNTGISRERTLIALQTQSLAASMHADRDYWDSAPNGLSVTVATTSPKSAPTITVNSDPAGTLQTPVNTALGALSNYLSTTAPSNCEYVDGSWGITAPCNPVYMAAYDLAQWGESMAVAAGASNTTIGCAQDATNDNIVSCTITVKWTENTVNANTQELAQQQTAGSGAFQTQTYQMVVQP